MKNAGGSKTNLQMGSNTENKFIDLIRNRLGIITKPDSYHLSSTIQDACKKFNCTPEEYLHHLEQSSRNSQYLEHLIAGITIGETYFFRDKNQMQLLYNEILPEIIKRKRSSENYSIRIWSAGSSSGEEIYTVAMMLDELILDKKKWQIHLLGTDINLVSLKHAIVGKYGEWSMRSIQDKYKEKYFKKEAGKYHILDAIKNVVTFDYLNLTDDVYPSVISNTFSQDLIICRNVLIYFDSPNIQTLMQRISKCLTPEAYLMLGSSDPVYLESTSLVRTTMLPSIFKNKIETKAVVDDEPYEPPKIKRPLSPSLPVKQTIVDAVDLKKYDEIKNLVANSQWNEVIAKVDLLGTEVKNDAFLLTSKASALANLGQTGDAITTCLKSLHIDRTNSLTYFILAMAYSESNDAESAETSFRKALFLDRKFVICYFQFGLFMIRHQHGAEGYRLLNNALKIAKQSPANNLVPYANGLTYKRLGEILEHETELYSGVDHH